MLWIDCRTDAQAPGEFSVCPDDPGGWAARYRSVFEKARALNGELALTMVSFAPAALQASKQAGMADGAERLVAALDEAHPVFDFQVANFLAAFSVPTYQGTSVLDFVHNYASVPDYGLQGSSIASTALWLDDTGALSNPATLDFLRQLYADNHIELGTKLYIEEMLYLSGAY
jgi:hypothetical protein